MPGPKTVIYGGHTCCVEIHMGRRLFVIDAGSGFEALGREIAATEPKDGRIDLLLSHLHHDHISGLPFFAPILNGHSTLRIFCGNQGGESAKAALDTMFAPPLFPVTLGRPAGPCRICRLQGRRDPRVRRRNRDRHLPAATSWGGDRLSHGTCRSRGLLHFGHGAFRCGAGSRCRGVLPGCRFRRLRRHVHRGRTAAVPRMGSFDLERRRRPLPGGRRQEPGGVPPPPEPRRPGPGRHRG